ncbi:major facilitator superfamily domain-containing protein 1-like [Uloborus diversus]|uniref:major facilitator superfamily domain-containing protein 1-like n=1 Tax=Uloborus diversus TaxID=327109 RepID=UPI00240900F5|nr:major facilitator superfamily domain-containing protein 1-like [Uloborus diversus]XP_054723457.1 major facilitator superfamily domain-containing protein 1-like [Uloborus diversus]
MKENPTRESNVNENVSTSEDEEKYCFSWAICNPRKTVHRYFALIFMCLLGFGSYFCYDNPAALQQQIIRDMQVSTQDFSSLYSWYSWPNVILAFFGGFLIDRVFGIRLGAIIFSLFILLGQLVSATGAIFNYFWIMQLGRFIFGVGGESLAVAQNTYAVSWFSGKELNMVFGLQLSLARVGSTVNLILTPEIYDTMSQRFSDYTLLGVTLFIASLTCVLSLVAALIMGFYDWRAEKILNKTAGQTGEVIRFKDIKDFPLTFWLISMVCVTYYAMIFPFIGLGTVFFARKYNLSQSEANLVDGIPYIISAFASPVLGLMVDKIGRNLLWVFVAVLLTLICHLLIGLTFINPWYLMIPIGLTYSLLACGLWPMVALEVPEYQLGTAYGIMQSIQNLGLAVVALAAGAIVDSKGYIFLEVFFIYFGIAAVISTILLFVVNSSRGGALNLSVKERLAREEELSRQELVENQRLLASGSMADVTPHDLMQPRSDFYIRNRFLSRIGAKLPPHFDITTCALIHRTGLK